MTSEKPPLSRAEQLEVARTIALNQLQARARSEHELRSALLRRNTPPDVAEEIIQRFTAVGLLDDAAFASALVNTRVEVQRRGAHRIRQELLTKGVAREVVEQALSQLSDEAELDAARQFASRRIRTLTSVAPMVAKRRLYGALARRGFSSDVVARVTDEMLAELDEHDP